MTTQIAVPKPTDPLAELSNARALLEHTRTLEDVKAIRAVAVAAQEYARAKGLGEEAQRYAAEIVLRAERRLGELLAEEPRQHGINQNIGPDAEPMLTPRKQVGKKLSARAQRLVAIPEEHFEQHIQTDARPNATALLREHRTATKAARIVIKPVAPLESLGPFPVLLADPPWRYEAGTARVDADRIENHYPTMSLPEILALNVPAADDSVLFLWATSPKLAEAIDVMRAWGFEYRTCAVWVKDKIGLGYYFRQQHELLLLGRCGHMPVPDPEDRPPSIIAAPRGMHSAKPEQVYDLIERMYPDAERCELFARQPRPGWASWGNQA